MISGTVGKGKDKAKEKVKAKAKSHSKKVTNLQGYVTLHESNLTLCLASGFLAARHEESAARDHHWRSGGKVIFTDKPVSVALISAARGGLDYGNVVIAELVSDFLVGGSKSASIAGAMEVPGPLPLSSVRRALFRTVADRDDFVAKVSGYADVPVGVVELAVDAAAFPIVEEPLSLFAQEAIEAQPYSVPQDYDKLGGGVLALLYHQASAGEVLPLELLQQVLTGVTGPDSLGEVGQALASGFDAIANASSNVVARAVAQNLALRPPKVGFNPTGFLDDLSEVVSAAGGEETFFDKFVLHAKDIIAARKDISDDAFEDAPGKIVLRALLLFVLNPDPERLSALRKRRAGLGKSVHLLALFFSGALKGLAGLPGAWKSADVRAFLGIGVLASNVFHGKALSVSISQTWDSGGEGRKILVCDGYPLLTQELPQRAEVDSILQYAQILKWKAVFNSSNGNLSLNVDREGAKKRVSVRFVETPTFPRESAIELSTIFDNIRTKREALRVIADVNDLAGSNALFARQIQIGKALSVEIFSFISCSLITKESLREATDAVFGVESSVVSLAKRKETT